MECRGGSSQTALRPQIAIAVVDTVDGDIESIAKETTHNS
jgi:hypothetical protein